MSRCTGMRKVRVSAGGAVKDVGIISSSKEQTEWIHREMPTEISSTGSSCFTSSGPVEAEYRLFWVWNILKTDFKEEKPKFCFYFKKYYWWPIPKQKCVRCMGQWRAWTQWNLQLALKCGKMGAGRTSAQRNPQEQVSTDKSKVCFFKFASGMKGQLCADGRGRKSIIRSCIISLTVNSFLFSMERQQLFPGLFAFLVWLHDGSAC